MKKLYLNIAMAALVCAGVTAPALAQDISCGDVTFVPAVYDRWPHADDACLEIVTRDDGNTYARFEGEILAQTPSGTFIRYTLRDGGTTERRKVNPPDGFMAHISGEAIEFNKLPERQKVNVYLPEAAWIPPEEVAEAPPPPPPPPAPEPEPEPVMPTTAGNLAWLAIFGALFLVLGGALRLARQQ